MLACGGDFQRAAGAGLAFHVGQIGQVVHTLHGGLVRHPAQALRGLVRQRLWGMHGAWSTLAGCGFARRFGGLGLARRCAGGFVHTTVHRVIHSAGGVLHIA